MKKLIIVLILMMISSVFAKCELKEYTNNTSTTTSKKFAFFCGSFTAVFIVGGGGNIRRVYETFHYSDGSTFETNVSLFSKCLSKKDEYGITEETNCMATQNNEQFMLERWKSYKNML